MSNLVKASVKDTNQSLNALCDEVEKKLYENKMFYEAVYEDRGFLVIDVDGDWKHDHLRIKLFVLDNFSNLEYLFTNSSDNSDDCYFGSQYYSVRE